IDGNYTLTIFSGQTVGGIQGGDKVTSLFRLFGDVNGDKAVNALDLGALRNAFGTASTDANYVSFLDFNGDGAINGADLAEFRNRFGVMLPYPCTPRAAPESALHLQPAAPPRDRPFPPALTLLMDYCHPRPGSFPARRRPRPPLRHPRPADGLHPA